jgi:hypothetical protein
MTFDDRDARFLSSPERPLAASAASADEWNARALMRVAVWIATGFVALLVAEGAGVLARAALISLSLYFVEQTVIKSADERIPRRGSRRV